MSKDVELVGGKGKDSMILTYRQPVESTTRAASLLMPCSAYRYFGAHWEWRRPLGAWRPMPPLPLQQPASVALPPAVATALEALAAAVQAGVAAAVAAWAVLWEELRVEGAQEGYAWAGVPG